MKATLVLTALLIASLAALHAADALEPKPSPDQSAGIDPDDGTAPRPDKAIPPKLIANPGSTTDYNRAKRTCTGVPSIAVSRGGRLWAAWFSGTTPGEIIERCPNAYVVVSTSGDGGKTWKEVLAIDPDGAGPLKAYDPHPWIDPDGKLWVFFTLPYPLHKHAWAITAEDGDQESPAWSPPHPVFEGVLLNKPAVLANGDWLFPTYARRPEHRGVILSQVSRDQGRTFTVPLHRRRRDVEPAEDPRHPAHALAFLHRQAAIGKSAAGEASRHRRGPLVGRQSQTAPRTHRLPLEGRRQNLVRRPRPR
jgi:hypothetical protein